ncbi:MAG: GTPase [archaeon]
MVKRIVHRIRKLFSSLFGSKKTVRLGIYGEPNTGKTSLANKISMDWLGKSVGEVSEMPHTTRIIQKVEHVEIRAGNKKLVMNLLDMPGLATQIDYRDFLKYKKSASGISDTPKWSDLTLANLKKIAKEKDIEFTKSTKKTTILKKVKENIKENELAELCKELDIKKKKKKNSASRKYTKEEAKTIAEEATKGVVEAIKWLDKVDSVLVMMDSTKDPLTQVNIMLIGNLEAKNIPIIIVANKNDLQKSDTDSIRNAFPQHPVVSISALKGNNLNELYKAISDHSM